MPPYLFIYFFSALFIWVSKNQNYGNPSSQSEQKSTSSLANEDSMQKQANYQKRGKRQVTIGFHDWSNAWKEFLEQPQTELEQNQSNPGFFSTLGWN